MNFFDHSSEMREDAVPTGYAVRDKEIFIVDDQRTDLGFNQVGEIAVRSRYIYPGYWNNSELTAAKFKADPQDPDMLIYFTGDLGLILPDGCLIHKGRNDFRQKIRGYAVDLLEVEQALLQHRHIREAGVRAWDREDGEKYLAGYLVPGPESELNASEIREFLSHKLPDYMIPSAFKLVEALPLTNGKLDRLALPKPDTWRPGLKETYVAPRNDVESKLVDIWSKVLQIDEVGIDDNFFDLGGYSLAGVRIIRRVKQEFGVELTIGDLLEFLTVAKMALCIGSR
jgi:acyl carrier protein